MPAIERPHEVDVLHAITSWLKTNAAFDEKDIAIRQKLTNHLRIDNMGLDELREVGKLAAKEGFHSVMMRCS